MKTTSKVAFSAIVFALAIGNAASPIKFVPPGPAQSNDDLSLPKGQTYYKFAHDVKDALDRDFQESSKIASAKSRFGREQILRKGGGVYVRLAGENLNVHLGYVKTTADGGENSGRSYAGGPGRNLADMSYPDLFKDLQNYARSTTDLSNFYRAFLKIVIDCDASDMTKLNDRGQVLLSDIISIWGAETNRNLMAKEIGLNKFDWQKHLGDVTMLAAFHAKTGLAWAADEGKLVKGNLDVFIGHGSEGSGVGGKGGIERRKFQMRLTSAMRQIMPEKLERIERITGKQSDIFHGGMAFINKDYINGNKDELIEAYVDLLQSVRDDGMKIASKVGTVDQ